MAYLQRDPFFPKFLQNHGIDKSVLGLNMSAYSASAIVANAVTGSFILQYVSRMNTMFIGTLLLMVYFFWSGCLDYLQDPDTIENQSYVASVIGGAGSGLLSTSIMATLCSYV